MVRIVVAMSLLGLALACDQGSGGIKAPVQVGGRTLSYVNHLPLHEGRVVNYGSAAPRDAVETQSLSFNVNRKQPAALVELLAQDRRSIAQKVLGGTITADGHCVAYDDRWGSRNVAYIVVDRDGELAVATLYNRSAKALPADRDREYSCEQATAVFGELHALYSSRQAALHKEIAVPFLGAAQ